MIHDWCAFRVEMLCSTIMKTAWQRIISLERHLGRLKPPKAGNACHAVLSYEHIDLDFLLLGILATVVHTDVWRQDFPFE